MTDLPHEPTDPAVPAARRCAIPWQLLREVGAALDPLVDSAVARLEAPGGREWVRGALAEQVAGSPEARLVREAVALARLIVSGAAADRPAPPCAAVVQMWGALADCGLADVAELASTAATIVECSRAGMAHPVEGAVRRCVGHYELTHPIGRGASGVVFAARHRDNGAVAAVKLLREEAWSPDQVTRFRDEARIAAHLQHPSIVRVLDSGVDESGGVPVPYLVSELVDGRRFDVAMANQPFAEVLRTFAMVCEAVAHAHERSVLHRDLTSANVLVDASGRPHLLDFGIARWVDEAAHRTRSNLLLGTATAMSPEQAAGARVDVCSEVWSLGALLFEALAQETPYDLRGLGDIAALRRIASEPPRRLQQFRADLPADLHAVVDKALSTDRGQRYPTVVELLQDVRRLLAGEAVAARPASSWRQMAIFARRHRSAAFGILTVVLVGVVGATTTTVLWRRAVGAEREALTVTESLLAFAGRLAETAAPKAEQRWLLESALASIAARSEVDGVDPLWLRAEARLRECLGDVEWRAGDGVAARRHRERVLALEQRLDACGAGDRAALAQAMVKMGDLDRDIRPQATAQWWQRAHAILLAAAATPGASLRVFDDLSWSYERLAVDARGRQAWSEARTLMQQRIALGRDLLARAPDGLRFHGMAQALAVELERRWFDPNDPEAAPAVCLPLAEEALDCAARALALDPRRHAYLVGGLRAVTTLAGLRADLGDLPAAVSTLESAGSWLRDLLQVDRAEPTTLRMAVLYHYLMGSLCVRAGWSDRAFAAWEAGFACSGDAHAQTVATGPAAGRVSIVVEARRLAIDIGDARQRQVWEGRLGEIVRAGVPAGAGAAELAQIAIWLAHELPEGERNRDLARTLVLRAVDGLQANPRAREHVRRALDTCGVSASLPGSRDTGSAHAVDGPGQSR